MRTRILLVSSLLALLILPLATPAAAAPGERVIPGRYIVTFYDDVDAEAAAHDLAGALGGKLGVVYQHAIKGFAGQLSAQRLAEVRSDPRVASVEPDREAWALQQVLPTGVDRIQADHNRTANINGSDERVNVDVAVIDTGIAAHPDLNRVGGANCTLGSCYGSGYDDGNGHGTHVAGTVGAIDNGSGVVGVAPGARLWAVRVLGSSGSGSVSGIIAGIDWVTSRASTIEVANLSLGCDCYSSAMNSALNRSTNAGVVYVAAAGNSARDGSGFTPAGNAQTIGVTAIADFNGQPGGGAPATCRTDVDDTFADFSSYGAAMDLAAPGVCINSTWSDGGYRSISGTSMASPHVAGAAALYVAEHSVPRNSSRWSVVRSGLINGWSHPQSGPCGFSGGRSPEPLLLLAPC